MSVDLEDYYQVQAFARHVNRADWDRFPSRVERNTQRVLDLLAETGTHATFFVLGWEARRRPGLIRQVAARGHEIASHGMSHRMLDELTPEEFRSEAAESRTLLEDVTGTRVRGFRAPSYSVNGRTLWAVEILGETGYEYDSSVYPIRRRRYGYPQGPKRPALLRGRTGAIAEFPLPTVPIGPIRFPVLAGAYLRLLPTWASLAALQYHRSTRTPAVVNVHPWELDPEQPGVGLSRSRYWAHYARLDTTESTLRRVLRAAPFRTVECVLSTLGLLSSSPVPKVAP